MKVIILQFRKYNRKQEKNKNNEIEYENAKAETYQGTLQHRRWDQPSVY